LFSESEYKMKGALYTDGHEAKKTDLVESKRG
jgi:hypothetical protein